MVVTRQLSGERLFQGANYVFLSIVALLFAFPIYNVLVNSFVGNLTSAAARVNLLPPRDSTLDAYRMLLGGSGQIVRAYGITLFRVVVGTLLNMLVTVLLSYGLSKTRLPYVKGITFFIFFTILFNGGLIPTYFLVRSLGLIDSVWALVIPILVNPWYALLLRNFFFSVPAEIEESAVMDGAHTLQIVFRIVIPLSMAAISTIALFYAVLHWNSWVDAVIYINSSRKWPVQLMLRQIMASAANVELSGDGLAEFDDIPPGFTVQCAAIIVTTVPILLVYPYIQKYFVKGVMVGSVKG